MAKKYLAFQDDLAQISNNDLVLKTSSSKTSLSDVALGTSIYIPETVLSITNNVEYIVVEKWNSIVTVMRKDLLNEQKMGTTDEGTTFADTSLYSWLNGEYLARFSAGIQGNFVEKAMLCTTYNSAIQTINMRISIPSAYELGLSGGGVATDGYYQWFQNESDRVSKYNETAKPYWTRTRFTNSYNYPNYRAVDNTGAYFNAKFDNTGRFVRPIIALTQTATVDADNILQSAGKSYLGTLEDVQDGDYFYKFKDIDGRISSSITYDNTTSGLTATNVKAAIDEVVSDISDKIDAPSSPSDGQILQDSSSGSAWVAADSAGGGFLLITLTNESGNTFSSDLSFEDLATNERSIIVLEDGTSDLLALFSISIEFDNEENATIVLRAVKSVTASTITIYNYLFSEVSEYVTKSVTSVSTGGGFFAGPSTGTEPDHSLLWIVTDDNTID